MLPLAALIGLHLLLTKQLSFIRAVKWGLASLVLALPLTVGVDSIFWRRLLWPEGEVLWFNSVLNKYVLRCMSSAFASAIRCG